MDPEFAALHGDVTVLAVPVYFGSMAVEYLWLRRRASVREPTAGDYERSDTVASLAMGVGSLAAPIVVPRLLRGLAHPVGGDTDGSGRRGTGGCGGHLGGGLRGPPVRRSRSPRRTGSDDRSGVD